MIFSASPVQYTCLVLGNFKTAKIAKLVVTEHFMSINNEVICNLFVHDFSYFFLRIHRFDSVLLVNVSVNQCRILRMIEVMTSLQDSSVWISKLRVVGKNVREGSRKQKSFQTPRKCRQRRGRDHIVRQTVPGGRSSDWEGLAANGSSLCKVNKVCLYAFARDFAK